MSGDPVSALWSESAETRGRTTPLRLLHRGYKLFVSPLMQLFGARCRFIPDCSTYAVEAIETHGVIRGSSFALRRLVRCHPWCEGGIDRVPPLSPPSSVAEGRRYDEVPVSNGEKKSTQERAKQAKISGFLGDAKP